MRWSEAGKDATSTIFNYKSHDDPVLRNVLYSSIIKSIKSKSDAIQELEFKHFTGSGHPDDDGKLAEFQLFDSRFKSQLMEIEYKSLRDFNLILKSVMNFQNVRSFYQFLQNNEQIESIELWMGSIVIEKFNQNADRKLAQSISSNMTLPPTLREILIYGLSHKSLNNRYCYSSLAELIRKLSNGKLSIYLDKPNLSQYVLRDLLCKYMERLIELYLY